MSQQDSSRRHFLSNLATGAVALPVGALAKPSWLAKAKTSGAMPSKGAMEIVYSGGASEDAVVQLG